jgi:predicted PurR-regulated permease PerM
MEAKASGDLQRRVLISMLRLSPMPMMMGVAAGWALGGLWGAVRGAVFVGLVFMPLAALIGYAVARRQSRRIES